VKFYVVAILFIVFDIEVAFLYPWAVLFRDLGLLGFVEMLFFVGVLLLGLIYAWKRGAQGVSPEPPILRSITGRAPLCSPK
jgi:NADH-quinone oxidoreductase subunit A